MSSYRKKHPSISKEHAIIEFQEKNQAFLKDLNSLNGTYMNKKRILSGNSIFLKDFDEISFGKEATIYMFNYYNEKTKENPRKNDEISTKDYRISVVEKNSENEKNCNFTAEFQRNEGFIEEELREKLVGTLKETIFVKEELLLKKENQIELLRNETGSLKEELEKVAFS